MPKRPKVDIRHFIVTGRPVGKERPRLVRNHVITPQRTKDYERHMRTCYQSAYPDAEPYTCDLQADIYAFFSSRKHPDLDNVIKTLDGLNGIAFTDDRLIKQINAFLIITKDEDERMEITLKPADSDMHQKVTKRITLATKS